MKKTIFRSIIILLAIVVFLNTGIVFAVDNQTCTLDIVADKTEIQPGETVTYEFQVSEINAGSGIAVMQAYIEYDSDIFSYELLDTDTWSTMMPLEDQISMYRSGRSSSEAYEPSSEDQTVAKVKFTAKANASGGTKTIKFKTISFGTGSGREDSGSFNVPDKTVKVKILSDSGEDSDSEDDPSEDDPSEDEPVDEDPTEEDPTEEDPVEDDDFEDENEIEEDDSDTSYIDEGDSTSSIAGENTSASAIPYTGIIGLGKILIFISVVGASIIFYRKLQKWNGI